MSAGTSPLLITWSSGAVSVSDPGSAMRLEGRSLEELLGDSYRGRQAVVAIGNRSSFIRNTRVPALSKEDTARLLANKLAPLIPLEPSEYVFGFKPGATTKGQGRSAMIGAVRTSTLRALHRDCAEAGLNLQAVLPAAFGSWFAAKAKGLSRCTVVWIDGGSFNIDLVDDGELCYSRSIAMPETAEDALDEIACAAEIAQMASGPVLALGFLGPLAGSGIYDFSDPKLPVEQLALPGAARSLFALELPENLEERNAAATRAAARRAVVAVVAAAVVCGLAFRSAAVAAADAQRQTTDNKTRYNQAVREQSGATDRALAARAQKLLMDQAFEPAQTASDVLHTLNSDAPPGIWLTGLSIERGKPLEIHGAAMKQANLSKLMANLAKDKRLRGMKLSLTTRSKIGEKTVIQFGVTGWIVGNLPIDEEPKAPGGNS